MLVLGHLTLPLELHRRRLDPTDTVFAKAVDDVRDLPRHHDSDAVSDAHRLDVFTHRLPREPLHDRVQRMIAPFLILVVAAPPPVPLRELRPELANRQAGPRPVLIEKIDSRVPNWGRLHAASCRDVPAAGRLDRDRVIDDGVGWVAARARESRLDKLAASLLAACLVVALISDL